MNKKRAIRAAAGVCVGVAAFTSAQAQTPTQDVSKVSIYGLLDASVGQFQNAGTDRLKALQSGAMSTSFLGFGGAENLGDGLKAVFALEAFLRNDTGDSGRFGGDAFFARAAYVGLSGGFGSLTLGRNGTPLFVTTLLSNAFGDSFGFSPSIRQTFTPAPGMLPFFGDTAWNNSIAYGTPSWGGLKANLLVNAGEGTPGSTGPNTSASVLYFGGPFAASLAWQKVKNSAFGIPPGWQSQDTWQIGGSYDFTAAKLYAQYEQIKTSATVNTKTTVYNIGASVPIGAGKVLAQYGHAKADFGAGTDATNKTLSLGYDYNLSKRTDVYAVAMQDRQTTLSNGNTLAVGIRTQF